LALAARRGEKGFSSILSEAIEEYLDSQRARSRRRKELLSLGGSISSDDAELLRHATRRL